jgi:hypothetical protein
MLWPVGDLCHEFVLQNPREIFLACHQMKIRTANTGPPNVQQDIALTRYWIWHVSIEPQLTIKDQCSHMRLASTRTVSFRPESALI